MKTRAFIGGVVALVVVVSASFAAFNPLRKAPDEIRRSLLAVTPLGSSVAAVRAIVEKKFGPEVHFRPRSGFLKQEKKTEVIGVSSLEVHLGAYREIPIPLPTDVTAFWGFDENGRLLDVWVWKTTDAP